jgi:hypothetical protein
MQLHTLNYFLWWCTPVLLSLVAVCMVRRRLYRDFPYFFNYVIFQVLSFAIEFPLRTTAAYFYVSWTTTALSAVISFAVLLEIFKDAFRPYEALRDLSLILFRWCALVILLVAGMWAVTSWRGSGIDNITSAIYLGTRCVRMMQCGLVFFMLLFSEYLSISRRNLVFGISIGFGIHAAVNMLIMTAASHPTGMTKVVLNEVNAGAWLVSMLIWLAYTLMPVKERGAVKVPAATSDRWDTAVDEVRNAPPSVSLLDSIDQTVDRLLYDRGTEASVTVPNRQ